MPLWVGVGIIVALVVVLAVLRKRRAASSK
jgi:hypothetical protein